MQKWIIIACLGLFYTCQQDLEDKAVMLEGKLITTSLAQRYIDNNDLIILYTGDDFLKTTCDTVVSLVIEVRNVHVSRCWLPESQINQVKEFNEVMEKELQKRGIDDYWATYRKEVLDCKVVLEY